MQPAHHLRHTCDGSVIQSKIVLGVCDLGVMWFKCGFSHILIVLVGISQPTMEILGPFESDWNVKFICHNLELG